MISHDELHKLENLAKLKFSEKEFQEFAVKVNSVMDMIDELQKVDCEDAKPMRSPSEGDLYMRSDQVTSQNIANKLFATVPEVGSSFAKEIKCFVVPKMVE